MDFLPSQKFMYALGGVIVLAVFFAALSQWGVGTQAPNAQLTLSEQTLTPVNNYAAPALAGNPSLSYASQGNLTAGVSQKLVSEYDDAQALYGTVTPEQIHQISTSLAATLQTQASTTQFVRKDVTPYTHETTANALWYGNNFALVTIASFASLKQDEVTLFLNVVQGTGAASTTTETLKSRAQGHRQYADWLKQLDVPISIGDDQLAIMNAQYQIAEADLAMAASFDDPIRALVAFNQYVTAEKMNHDALIAIINYLDAKNVVFAPSDWGYKLFGASATSTPATPGSATQ